MRLFLVLGFLVGSTLRAQDTTTTASAPVVPAPTDSVLRHAEQMVGEGHGAAGRALVDSVLAQTQTGTPQYAEVLFVKASIAATAAETERDFRRVTVEYPSSPRADDALLRLAQYELARGDKEEARQHLMRLDRDRPPASTSPHANLSVARAWFELDDPSHACAALSAAHSATPSSQVEFIHQLDYAAGPCAGLPTTVAAAPPAAASHTPLSVPLPVPTAAGVPAPTTTTTVAASTTTAAASTTTAVAPAPPVPTPATTGVPASTTTTSVPAPTPSVPAPSTSVAAPTTSVAAPTTTSAPTPATTGVPTPATTGVPAAKRPAPVPAPTVAAPTRTVAKPSTGGGTYTVQVAAYDTRGAAEALASKLRDRGYDVRVWGAAAPFRVRIGHYPTRGAAERELSALQAKQMSGFVTTSEPPSN